MNLSSPSSLRLPHASAGPFWRQPAWEPHYEWHEIETLLTAPPAYGAGASRRPRRNILAFAVLAALAVLGGSALAVFSLDARTECGVACHTVIAKATPAVVAPSVVTPPVVATAALATPTVPNLTEGRSAAEPVLDMTSTAAVAPDSAASDPVIPEPVAPPLPHRHHHHHRHP